MSDRGVKCGDGEREVVIFGGKIDLIWPGGKFVGSKREIAWLAASGAVVRFWSVVLIESFFGSPDGNVFTHEEFGIL